MQEVDIYLFPSSRAPSVTKGRFEYILSCGGKSLYGNGETGPVSGHRLALACAVAALGRMTRAAMITIHTDCNYLLSGRAYLAGWRAHAWTKPDGEPVRNADLWQELYEVSRPHAIKYEYCPTICAQNEALKHRLSPGNLPGEG